MSPEEEMDAMLAATDRGAAGAGRVWAPPEHLVAALDKVIVANATRIQNQRLGPKRLVGWLAKQGYNVGETTLRGWMTRRAAEILKQE
jgi:hypothetical protein